MEKSVQLPATNGEVFTELVAPSWSTDTEVILVRQA